MDLDFFSAILSATIRTGTPLLLVALGEMLVEKSGVLNLGQEGMLLIGAVAGFIAASQSDSLVLGFMAAIAGGIGMAFIFAIVTLFLNANQIATGLALTIFGVGLSAFLGADYEGKTIAGLTKTPIPLLSDIPFIGALFFDHDVIVYVSWTLFIGMWLLFKKSTLGLNIRAVGENPDAANAIGINVIPLRFALVLVGGALAGLAGGYLSLVYTPLWTEDMSAGRGWIALAIVVFASWKATRVLLGAYLFGFASILHLAAQGMGVNLSANLLAMLPYVATIVVLVILSRNKLKLQLSEPLALAKPWRKE
ncbi:MAG: ABC transporter permease [Cellvibrionales bacterium]|nr:ABC transporter permease [Cellvibrionales bacterium]